MFLAFNVLSHLVTAKAAGQACALSSIASEIYPVSVLCPAPSTRLALGREDSS